MLIQVTLSLHTHLQQALDSVTGLAVNNSQIQPGLLGMLTAPRRWIKSWLRTITVEQSAETVLPVTDRQTMPLSYSLRDFDLTGVISIFMKHIYGVYLLFSAPAYGIAKSEVKMDSEHHIFSKAQPATNDALSFMSYYLLCCCHECFGNLKNRVFFSSAFEGSG